MIKKDYIIYIVGGYMKNISLWSVGNGFWIIHIKKTLAKRFLERFDCAELVSTYYKDDLNKPIGFDYKFKSDPYLSTIRKWAAQHK